MHVVEFQKRGLPHAHIALRLEGSDDEQPKSQAEIDRFISARLHQVLNCDAPPATCPCTDHRLQRLIAKDMTHVCKEGRCYPVGEPCVCSSHYPMDATETTYTDDKGYAIYRRDPEDVWVVPHNIDLCRKYWAHINVELACSVKFIRYMHK